jgi:hypothetical protein
VNKKKKNEDKRVPNELEMEISRNYEMNIPLPWKLKDGSLPVHSYQKLNETEGWRI